MNEKPKHNWISNKSNINFHQSFIDLMETQLVDKANAKLGVADFGKKGFGMVLLNKNLRMDDKGFTYIKGDLICPDAYGYMITIAWKCKDDENAKISVNEEIGDLHVEFFWW